MAEGVEAWRLDEARDGVPWKEWGPYLSERQWGTVREDYSDNGDAWSYFSHDQARSRAYKWGEDGIAGLLRRPPAAVLRVRAVERRRPDPQGADVRPDQRRGQPRRGRQGVLLLPRRHADELVPEVPVPLPARRVPVRRSRRRPTAPRSRTRAASTSCSTPASSTTTATSTSTSSTPRRRPTTSTSASRVTNRGAERGDGAPAADAVVPQHVVDGPAEGRRCARGDAPAVIAAEHPELGELELRCDGDAGAAVHRERDEHRAAVGHAERHAVREGRLPRVRRRRADRRRQPGAHGHEGGRALRAGRPAGGAERRRSCACAGRTPRAARRRTAVDAACSPTRIAEADEFYASITPRGHAGRRGDGDAPGAGRDAVEQAVLLLRPRPLARGARRATRCATSADPTSRNRELVPHDQRRRHLDARHVGVPVVRVVGPGVPHGRAGAWSTSTSPRTSSS